MNAGERSMKCITEKREFFLKSMPGRVILSEPDQIALSVRFKKTERMKA
jgi:hypothetical protein